MSMATEPRKGQSKFVVTDMETGGGGGGGGGGGSVTVGGHTNRAFEIDMDNNVNSHSQYQLQEFTSSDAEKYNGRPQREYKSSLHHHRSPPKKSGRFFPSIGLLLWKNTLLRRRHFVVTTLEIILPTLFACLIAFFKTWTPPTPPVETNIITNSTQFFEKVKRNTRQDRTKTRTTEKEKKLV